ncbi:hypothetical protein JCM3765_005206 [Sporobolomyces pararoseus]
MSSAQIRLTEPQVFLVGSLEYERARARQRRAVLRETVNANRAGSRGGGGGDGDGSTESPSLSRRNSPERERGERGRSVFHLSTSRQGSRSRPGSRAPSPRGRNPLLTTTTTTGAGNSNNNNSEEFIPPNSRGRSASRTRTPSQPRIRTQNENLSVGRSGSLVRDSDPSTSGHGGGDQGLSESNSQLDEPPPALLRGLLTVTLSKPTRVKEITVRLKGTAKTDWPEGIGPRRLDVVEENLLINYTHAFFSASQSTTTRRAASVDPYSRDESRGRAPSRRAASLAPGRESSHGRSYPHHNSLFPNGLDNPPPVLSSIASSHPTNVLSRISSNDSAGTSVPPPIRPGEAAPAYEAVPSAPPSPLHLPQTIQEVPSGEEQFELAGSSSSSRPSPSTNSSYQRLRSPTPSRSPLGMSPSLLPSPSTTSLAGIGMPRLSRSTTRASQESQTSTSSSASRHTTRSNDVDEADTRTTTTAAAAGDRSDSSLVSNSSTSSINNDQRGRRTPSSSAAATASGQAHHPPELSVITDTTTTNGTAQQSRSSLHSFSNRPSPSPSGTTSPISSAAPRLPSAMKSKGGSGGGGSTSRSGSHARFSLGGLTDALRGKRSSSKGGGTRTPTEEDHLHRPPFIPRRDSSPDVSLSTSNSRPSSIKGGTSGSGRSQSRGRKTALKVLREALTTGHAHLYEQQESLSGGGARGEEYESSHHNQDEQDNHHQQQHGDGWKEFKAGTYVYPISIPVPGTLPPSLNCEFGSVSYNLKATVVRAGALTTNLTSHQEVILVAMPGEDDTEESESIVVERFWETQMKYHVALSGKSFPIGGQIPLTIRLSPLAKVKVFRISAQLEQKTSYYASVNSGRKLTRHETPRKVMLVRVDHPKDPDEPMLPILSEDQNVLIDHPLRDWFINATSSDDTTPSLLDPNGPWHLEHNLQLPDCSSKINFSTHHEKANIAISHVLKIMIRVERGDDEFLDTKGKRKRWDIVVETPVHLLSCRCAQNLLPAYTASTATLSTGGGGRGGFGGQPGFSSSSTSGSSSIITRALRTATGGGHSSSSSPHEYTCGGGGAAMAQQSTASHSANMRATGIGATSSAIHRSSSSSNNNNHHSTPVASLEQNLLFARLISGETTPNGETPPTYQEVSNSSNRETTTSQVQSTTGGGGGGGGGGGRSSTIVVVDDDEEDSARGRSRSRA